jgi:hypothetical protein
MAHPESVREAWIEVLDRPLLLDRKSVAVQAHGEVDWKWDDNSLHRDWEQQENSLTLSIWDPNGVSVTCDEHSVMTAQPGGEVSKMTVGGRGKFSPDARLNPSLVRVAQNSPEVTFYVTGFDLTPKAKFDVHSEKGARCENRSVHAEVLDLSHARITVGGECLAKAGVLFISSDDDKEHAVWVHVASPTSPVLLSVSPSEAPADMPQDQLELVVRGSGFTKDSTVYAGYLPTAGSYEMPQLPLDTEYVSPTELRTSVDSAYGNDALGKQGEKLRIWVMGNEENFELSEARDIELQLPAGSQRLRKTALITSVSPFPIQLMDEHSPKELRITIRGENFIPENKVIFTTGGRSEYISPHLLRAWIPRQLWRKHQITYRLVVETKSGQRYVQSVDDTGDEE